MNKLALAALAGTALVGLSACSDKDQAMISDNEAADAAAAMPAEETVPAVEDEAAEGPPITNASPAADEPAPASAEAR